MPELGVLRVVAVFALVRTLELGVRKQVLPGAAADTVTLQPVVADRVGPAADMKQQVAVGIQVRRKRAWEPVSLVSVVEEYTAVRLLDNTASAVAAADRNKALLDRLVAAGSVFRDSRAKASTRLMHMLVRKAARRVGRKVVVAFRSTLAVAAKLPMR